MFKPITAPDRDHIIHLFCVGQYNLYMTVHLVSACDIWYVNDGVMLQRKSIQKNQIQAMKESTPGLNDYIGITINLAETFVNKKIRKETFAEDTSLLLTRKCTLIDKLKN